MPASVTNSPHGSVCLYPHLMVCLLQDFELLFQTHVATSYGQTQWETCVLTITEEPSG